MRTLRSMLFVAGLALLTFAQPALAQSYVDTGFRDLPPPLEKKNRQLPPKLVFRLLGEIPLPGPLPSGDPVLRDDEVEIAVAGGRMKMEAIPDAVPRWVDAGLDDPLELPEPSAWVTGPGGKVRFRSLPGGVLEAQKACPRCKTGWKRRWRLRIPGNTLVSPLVADRRVYIGGLDNRVYCLKVRNGHRVWTADVDGRVSFPLTRWQGEIADPQPEAPLATRELSLIVAVVDSGSEMVALETKRGDVLGTLRLPEGEGKLVSGALAMPDGKVLVARQQYAETEASLMLYRVIAPQALAARDVLTQAEKGAEEVGERAPTVP